MENESKTADGRHRWQRWTEEQARSALQELAQSGLSVAKFAERKGVSVQRIAYWKRRLADAKHPSFVSVDLSAADAGAGARIEVVLDGVMVRVREDLDAERVAGLIGALVARRPRGC